MTSPVGRGRLMTMDLPVSPPGDPSYEQALRELVERESGPVITYRLAPQPVERPAPRAAEPEPSMPPAQAAAADEREAPAEQTSAPERLSAWPAPEDELRRLVEAGLTNREIAERYGIPVRRVVARLGYYGIQRTAEQARQLQMRGAIRGARNSARARSRAAAERAERRAREAAIGTIPAQGDAAPLPGSTPEATLAAIRALAQLLARQTGGAVEVEVRLVIRGEAGAA